MTVRKRIGEDCLVNGELHVNIAERLERLRQLPVSAAANLHGVVTDEKGIWLEWQFIPGVTLEAYLSHPHSKAEVDQVMRELRHAVAAMHSHGIVHGALHGRNIIVDPLGKVRLTHVSPLLHNDPAVDLLAVERLVNQGGASKAVDNRNIENKLRRAHYLLAIIAMLAGFLIFLAILWYIRGR